MLLLLLLLLAGCCRCDLGTYHKYTRMCSTHMHSTRNTNHKPVKPRSQHQAMDSHSATVTRCARPATCSF
jgi:hypothetical protein